jgi:hypothetical protein
MRAAGGVEAAGSFTGENRAGDSGVNSPLCVGAAAAKAVEVRSASGLVTSERRPGDAGRSTMARSAAQPRPPDGGGADGGDGGGDGEAGGSVAEYDARGETDGLGLRLRDADGCSLWVTQPLYSLPGLSIPSATSSLQRSGVMRGHTNKQ